MSDYTPGPWAFGAYVSPPIRGRELASSEGSFVAFVGGGGGGYGIDPEHPDARLIAAAPQLAEALSDLLAATKRLAAALADAGLNFDLLEEPVALAEAALQAAGVEP